MFLHWYELGDVVNFLLCFAIHRRNEGVVTYGIRAGSTRDLGFATAFVDMSGFYYTVVDGVDGVRAQ